MTLYSIILFLHIAAVLALFASLSFEVLSLFHLRRASDLNDVHRWIDPVPGIRLVAIGSILVVLFSGVYLAVRMSAFDLAWPKVAIVALLLIATFGALTGKRRRAIRRSSAAAAKMKPELVAVPVASPSTCAEFETEVDKVVCATTPEPFWAVGQWYRDFSQTTDEEVRELLARAAAPSVPRAA
jgi:hypothetical protein